MAACEPPMLLWSQIVEASDQDVTAIHPVAQLPSSLTDIPSAVLALAADLAASFITSLDDRLAAQIRETIGWDGAIVLWGVAAHPSPTEQVAAGERMVRPLGSAHMPLAALGPLAALALQRGDGFVGAALRQRAALAAGGAASYRATSMARGLRARHAMLRYLEALPDVAAAAMIPLISGGEQVGAIELLSFAAAVLPVAAERAQVIAPFVASAVLRSQAASASAAQQRRFDAVSAIGTAVSTTADLAELAANVVGIIVNATSAAAGALALIDDAALTMTTIAAIGPAAATGQPPVVKIAGSVAEEVIRYAQPLRGPLRSPQWAYGAPASLTDCLQLPLLAGGTVVGVLSLYGSEATIDQTEMTTLMMIGNLIGFAIANIQLYQESQIERRKLAALINSMAEGVAFCDGLGRMVLTNQRARDILGIERFPKDQSLDDMPDYYGIRELNGTPLPAERLPLARALAGEVFYDFRHLLRVGDGPETIVATSGAPVFSESGEIEGAVVQFRDVTQIERLDRAKDDFLAVAAHELRSPLAAIQSYTELLMRRQAAAPTPGFALLARQVEHMLQLVDNLLDVSRIDADQFTLSPRPSDLVALAQRAVEQFAAGDGGRRIALHAEADALPLDCDQMRVRQVLTNLLSNALRYTPQSAAIAVRVWRAEAEALAQRHPSFAALATAPVIAERAPLAVIAISDDGPGIPPERVATLFTRPSRGRDYAGKGLGIGLFISGQIVSHHRGWIWAESEVGVGSTFLVALPAYTNPT